MKPYNGPRLLVRGMVLNQTLGQLEKRLKLKRLPDENVSGMMCLAFECDTFERAQKACERLLNMPGIAPEAIYFVQPPTSPPSGQRCQGGASMKQAQCADQRKVL